MCETLNNPADVWENPFSAQLDDYGRAMVLLVTLNGGTIMSEQELAEAYSRFTARPESHAMNGRRDYTSNLRHLTSSLLSRKLLGSVAAETPYINLFNPSLLEILS